MQVYERESVFYRHDPAKSALKWDTLRFLYVPVNVAGLKSPASGVSDASSRIPGNRGDLIVGFLNPNRMVIGEVNDATERFAVIKTILHKGIAGHAGDAKLNPCV